MRDGIILEMEPPPRSHFYHQILKYNRLTRAFDSCSMTMGWIACYWAREVDFYKMRPIVNPTTPIS